MEKYNWKQKFFTIYAEQTVSLIISAITPLLVLEDQLTKCAGYSQSLQSISYIISPAAQYFYIPFKS